MGLLVEGQWVDQWYDTKKAVENLSARRRNSATGLQRTAVPGRVVETVLKRKAAVTTCMFPWPALGPIAL